MAGSDRTGLLLDSNVVLFWLSDERALRADAREAIERPSNRLVVSVATIWELEIKKRSGRLRYPDDLWEQLGRRIDEFAPIGRQDAMAAAALPAHHGDPFDRMLIAQALVGGLTIVTRDETFQAYDVPMIRA